MHSPFAPPLIQLILAFAGFAVGNVAAMTPPGPPAARTAQASEPAAVWPLHPKPSVVAGFAPPEQQWESGHRGVDLAASPGQPALAALAGTVAFAGMIGGKPVVSVQHPGRGRTTYEPVVGSVERGQAVETGQVLGRVSLIDSHCFPRACLHWGLKQGPEYLDPLALLGGGSVRLLPLGHS